MSKVLVNIHGAGKEMSNFYVEGLNALTKIMGSQPACLPCWYADLSNIGGPVSLSKAKPLSPKARKFRADFTEQIRKRRVAVQRKHPNRLPTGPIDDALLAADVIADVTRYLFDADLQRAVRKRLIDVLNKAKQSADETILVSHSLGTVVSFDVLHDGAQNYNVTDFVTMGSPLHKLVNVGVRSSDVGAIRRKTVRRWRNIYDTTDAVADPIRPAFTSYGIKDIFVNIADDPIPSHDYWRNDKVLKMLADMLG